MALEDLCVQNQVMFGVHELLYSYFLKESDKDKGRYLINLRHDWAHFVIDLRLSDKNWKDWYFFMKGDAIFGERGQEEILCTWRATSEKLCLYLGF